MKALTKRNIVRALHLIGAVCIGTYVYSPWKNLEWFGLLNQVLVIPILAVSGLWMWKGQKFKNWLGNNKG